MPNSDGTVALTKNIPNVPAWALAAQKPTYTAAEVGATSPAAVSNIVSTVYIRDRAAIDLTNLVPAAPVVKYADKTHVTVIGGLPYRVGDAAVFMTTNTTIAVADALDAGSITHGTDYAVYITSNPGNRFVVSTNQVAPAGYTAATAKRLGGFHTICRDVPADLQKAPVSVFGGALHELAGWSRGDILPRSVWAINFRPSCPDPTGMVYAPEVDTWIDIYNGSGSIYAPQSRFGGARLHSKTAVAFWTGYGNTGKLLLSDMEFWFAAVGSNCGTKESTSGSDVSHPPTNDTTGGHVDTNGYPMISSIGCEEMCGLQAQWLRDFSANSGGSWDLNNYPTIAFDGNNNSFGAHYAMANYRAVLAGGGWTTSSVAACGPLYRSAADSRSLVAASLGGRGSSRSLHTIPNE